MSDTVWQNHYIESYTLKDIFEVNKLCFEGQGKTIITDSNRQEWCIKRMFEFANVDFEISINCELHCRISIGKNEVNSSDNVIYSDYLTQNPDDLEGLNWSIIISMAVEFFHVFIHAQQTELYNQPDNEEVEE